MRIHTIGTGLLSMHFRDDYCHNDDTDRLSKEEDVESSATPQPQCADHPTRNSV